VERPTQVDEASLERRRPVGGDADADRPPTAPVAIGHVPLSHATFRAWKPEFVAMALVDPEELLGYEEWKLAKGGFF
jgi:hypothetical protein